MSVKVHSSRIPTVRRKKYRRSTSEYVELAGKIFLTVVIALVALAVMGGVTALCIWAIVFGVNDIADNGFNLWAAFWVGLGVFGLSGTPSAGSKTLRR